MALRHCHIFGCFPKVIRDKEKSILAKRVFFGLPDNFSSASFNSKTLQLWSMIISGIGLGPKMLWKQFVSEVF
jgi:hypothetical protein